MKSPWKSKTIIGLVLMLIASAPDLSDPLWQVMTTAGLPDQWVAILKLAAYVAGAVGVAYGRIVASGPLVLRK